MPPKIPPPFDPDQFRKNGHLLVDALADYLGQIYSADHGPVLPNCQPDELVDLFSFEDESVDPEEFSSYLKRILQYSHHLHHPRYIGHQVSSPLPLAALMHACTALLNNGAAIYEMGPVVMAMERNVIRYFGAMIGYQGNFDGVFTHGGSAGNLTALLAVRQAMANRNVWEDGVSDSEKTGIMVSEQSHYSVTRAAKIMGLGESSIVKIPITTEYKAAIDRLEECKRKAEMGGIRVVAVVANSCSTATGSYDDLEAIGRFCEKHGLWMHVDGAHGMGVLTSEKYRHLIRGIERADSIVIDFHKMFLAPALNSMVLFKNGDKSYETFAQKATYLFSGGQGHLWHNGATRTLECTKSGMGIIAYTVLKYYRAGFIREYIESRYDLARQFAARIRTSELLQLALMPESNIVCFRFAPEGNDDSALNKINAEIRRQIVEEGGFYIVQTDLGGRCWLRITIINPLTSMDDLDALISTVMDTGRKVLARFQPLKPAET